MIKFKLILFCCILSLNCIAQLGIVTSPHADVIQYDEEKGLSIAGRLDSNEIIVVNDRGTEYCEIFSGRLYHPDSTRYIRVSDLRLYSQMSLDSQKILLTAVFDSLAYYASNSSGTKIRYYNNEHYIDENGYDYYGIDSVDNFSFYVDHYYSAIEVYFLNTAFLLQDESLFRQGWYTICHDMHADGALSEGFGMNFVKLAYCDFPFILKTVKNAEKKMRLWFRNVAIERISSHWGTFPYPQYTSEPLCACADQSLFLRYYGSDHFQIIKDSLINQLRAIQ